MWKIYLLDYFAELYEKKKYFFLLNKIMETGLDSWFLKINRNRKYTYTMRKDDIYSVGKKAQPGV